MTGYGSSFHGGYGMLGAPQIEVAAAIVVPMLAFILNWNMRARHGYALSAAADFALSLAAFDLIALIYSNVFIEVMRNDVFRQSFIRLTVILFAITLIAWMTIFLRLEHRMTEGYDFFQARRYFAERPMGSFLLGWTLLAALFGIHIFAYLYE